MLTVAQVIHRIREEGFELAEEEVVAYVEQEWVLATRRDEAMLFDEADTARIKFICELQRDMAVNDEAVPVILKLLDQLYGLRRVLDEVHEAVRLLPPDLRQEFEARLAKVHEA